jgi:hypothetical protein
VSWLQRWISLRVRRRRTVAAVPTLSATVSSGNAARTSRCSLRASTYRLSVDSRTSASPRSIWEMFLLGDVESVDDDCLGEVELAAQLAEHRGLVLLDVCTTRRVALICLRSSSNPLRLFVVLAVAMGLLLKHPVAFSSGTDLMSPKSRKAHDREVLPDALAVRPPAVVIDDEPIVGRRPVG